MSIKDQLDSARKVIDLEITRVISNSSLIKNGGCASCHILFNLIETLCLNESSFFVTILQSTNRSGGISLILTFLFRVKNHPISFIKCLNAEFAFHSKWESRISLNIICLKLLYATFYVFKTTIAKFSIFKSPITTFRIVFSKT
jgi:hypothetical protein